MFSPHWLGLAIPCMWPGRAVDAGTARQSRQPPGPQSCGQGRDGSWEHLLPRAHRVQTPWRAASGWMLAPRLTLPELELELQRKKPMVGRRLVVRTQNHEPASEFNQVSEADQGKYSSVDGAQP